MLAYDIILELNAPVAQLDRVTGYEPVGRGFESLQPYQKGRLKKILGVKAQCFQGFRGP